MDRFMNNTNDGVILRISSVISSPFCAGLFGLVAIICLLEIWMRSTYAYKTLRNIPSPPRLPIIGHAHLVFGLSNVQLVKKALEFLQVYGETIFGNILHVKLVFITNPADVEIILNSQAHLEKAEEYRYFKPWFGDGLLISKGDHWRHHRKMIAPTFHQTILKSFVPNFVKYALKVADKMEHMVGKEFDVHYDMSQTTVEILLSTAMGVKNMPTGSKCFEYAEAVLKMCNVIHKRQIQLLYRYDITYKWTRLRRQGDRMMKIILSMSKGIIAERRKNFNPETDGVFDDHNNFDKMAKSKEGFRDDLDEIDENDVGSKQRLALLDAMVELTKRPDVDWTEQDVIDEVNTIMFEGHDTTAAGASFVLCLLGIHKDIQDKVYEEQKTIFGDHMQRECAFTDATKMQYLERVIKETLRLYPPVPAIARKITEDVKLVSGPYTIPKGTTVVLGPYAVHRRPDIYENPEKFNPDNFLPENVSKRHYYSYIPFSAGPRSCVGRKYAMLMLKVLLSTLLRRYQIHSNMTEEDFQLEADIILKLGNGFNIQLTRRN